MVVVSEASDRICGTRLKVALPNFVDSMDRHGAHESRSRREGTPPLNQRSHTGPAAQTHPGHRGQPTQAKTKDVLGEPDPGAYLQRLRPAAARLSGSRPGAPLRRDSIWFLYPQPGGHRHLHGMEAVPMLTREQSLVVEGLEAIARQLPFPALRIDSYKESVFINQTLMEFCAGRGIEFARSRGYRKNDQAWIEQKNGSVGRRFACHERYSGQIAGQTMVHLYKAVRLHVNHFQPSFKAVGEDPGRGQGHQALQPASQTLRPGHAA